MVEIVVPACPDNHLRMSRTLIVIILLITVTAAVYWQVRDHEYVYYDDRDYVVENRHVQSGLTMKGLRWAFTSTYASNWHPLTWLSHMADWQAFEDAPAGPHLVNLALHILNSVLLLLLLHRMTGGFWQSAFVAALFALHPLHVESVAWVAERKDVLSTLFFMFTLLSYARYAEQPNASRYLATLLCFLLGLMAKPMLVTLPFVLLLLDLWPLKRLDLSSFRWGGGQSQGRLLVRLVLEKTPFFLFALLSSIVTLIAQRSAMASIDHLPLADRIGNAMISYAGYIMKMVWPSNLSVFYPLTLEYEPWRLAGAVVLLIAVSVWAVWQSRKRPYLLVGWMWYVGTLVPVIGIVQVGSQAMADRYTYIPLIGIFLMATWTLSDAISRWPRFRTAAAVSGVLLLTVFSGLTWAQAGYWKDSYTLFSRCASLSKDNYVAEHALGMALAKLGRDDDAAAHILTAIRLHPNDARAYNDLGLLLARRGDRDGALQQFFEAVRIAPDNLDFRYELGVALVDAGRLDEAIKQYFVVLRDEPDHEKARVNIGVAFALKGDLNEAAKHFSKALELNPANENARRSLYLARRVQSVAVSSAP